MSLLLNVLNVFLQNIALLHIRFQASHFLLLVVFMAFLEVVCALGKKKKEKFKNFVNVMVQQN